jgi:AAA family ATP:ADP antiporter
MAGRRFFDVRTGEGRALLLAGAGFVLVMFVNGVLRSLRDGLPDVKDMPGLFTGTFLGTLVVMPIYLWVVQRFPRRRIVPIGFIGIAVSFAAFALACPHVADWRHPTPEEAAALRPFAATFWLWFSTVNVLCVALFWSLAADLFGLQRGRRLFAAVSMGGTIGSLLGAQFTAHLAQRLEPAALLLISTVALLLSCALLAALQRATAGWSEVAAANRARPIGGGLLDGARHILQRPYLRGVAAQVLCLTAIATFSYMIKVHVVRAEGSTALDRVAGFARIDSVGCAVELLLQILLTGPLLAAGGLAACLRALPVMALLSSILLWLFPSASMVGLLEGVRSATQYAVYRPARELLFTVVPPLEIYGAKGCIDTLVYRGGDVLTVQLSTPLFDLAGTAGLALAGVPVALSWYVLAGWLARAHERQAAQLPVSPEGQPA